MSLFLVLNNFAYGIAEIIKYTIKITCRLHLILSYYSAIIS